MGITNGTLIKQGNVWHWKYRLDGKTTWESLKVGSKRDAELIRQERIALYHADRGNFYSTDLNPPIDDLLPPYREWASTHLRPKTIEGAEWAVGHFLRLTKVKTFGDVQPRNVQRFKKLMAGEGKNNTSINNALRALRAFVNRAKKNGWYNGDNPFTDFDRLPEEKTKPRWLDNRQIDDVLLIARQQSANAYLFFALGLYAGLRKGEIDAARWTWIDWKQKYIHVQGDEHFTIKNKQERTIPLNDKLAIILREQRAIDGYIIAPESQPAKYRYRFDIRKGFAAVVSESGIDWLTPHVLRHTFASQLVQAGVNIFKVGQWLGHADPTTTAIYAHLAPHDEDINRI